MDQRKARFRIPLLSQVSRNLGDDYFKRWPHMCLREMPRHSVPIAPANNQMNMEGRLTGRRLRDVADERGNLDLLLHGNSNIILFIPVKILKN